MPLPINDCLSGAPEPGRPAADHRKMLVRNPACASPPPPPLCGARSGRRHADAPAAPVPRTPQVQHPCRWKSAMEIDPQNRDDATPAANGVFSNAVGLSTLLASTQLLAGLSIELTSA